MNIAATLDRSAAAHPDVLALRLDDETLTYRELDARVGALAATLRARGVGPGDRVVLSLPNIPLFAVAYYAILRLGAVVVPMNPLFKPREVEYFVRDSGARLLLGATPDSAEGARAGGAEHVDVAQLPALVDEGRSDPVEASLERADDDIAVIVYTSGTTGRPKGAVLGHGSLLRNVEVTNSDLIDLGPGEVMMGCLPLFHIFGMTCGMNLVVANAGTMTLVARFDPAKVLEILERDAVTVFEGVPTMYAALLAAARVRREQGLPDPDISRLRHCITGGAAMPVEVMRAFEEHFGCIVLEGYGMSETSPVISFNPPVGARKPGSVGLPIDGVQMAIAGPDGELLGDDEVGEILVRGHNLMQGYWGLPQESAEALRDGWFHTGDIGTRDGDGYYRIVDRAKDMIIRGGYNVYPREIEEVLYEHPAVAEVAVVGLPHEHYGEEVAAYVALAPGATATAEELQAFAKERVAAYKYPREIRFVEALPKGATGKILKRDLPR